MPYIEPGRVRDELTRLAVDIGSLVGNHTGDLNYLICRIYCAINPRNYADKSRWHAAVQDAADEIKRRDIDPYEDRKAALPDRDLPWPSNKE